MVSKAREDLPDPLNPVTTVRVLRGISTSMFLRLCWRAPRTEILVIAIWRWSESRDFGSSFGSLFASFFGTQVGLPFRNVDRSTELSDSRGAQLYFVFYYGAASCGASESSLAAGFNAGRLKKPRRRKLGRRHLITAI